MIPILIAGIAGASLGTEIAKSLRLAGGYKILGCDISPFAFGHYSDLFDNTAVISSERYIEDLLAFCLVEKIAVIVPGANETLDIIVQSSSQFENRGIKIAANSLKVVSALSNKHLCFQELDRLGIEIPETKLVSDASSVSHLKYPCVIKPATGSGGSAYVFFARNADEASIYANYLVRNGRSPIAQTYIDHRSGEFTVGVLSAGDGSVVGAIAMKRMFASKLSVQMRSEEFLISSGYSQGYFDAYEGVCATAKQIADLVGSVGPLNIQGRINDVGNFIPFEINPRFSATTYLRALAGFNEIDYFIRALLRLPLPTLTVRSGWCFRSLTETTVVSDGIVK